MLNYYINYVEIWILYYGSIDIVLKVVKEVY